MSSGDGVQLGPLLPLGKNRSGSTPLPQNQTPKRVGKPLSPAYAVPLRFRNASSGGSATETARPPSIPRSRVRREICVEGILVAPRKSGAAERIALRNGGHERAHAVAGIGLAVGKGLDERLFACGLF